MCCTVTGDKQQGSLLIFCFETLVWKKTLFFYLQNNLVSRSTTKRVIRKERQTDWITRIFIDYSRLQFPSRQRSNRGLSYCLLLGVVLQDIGLQPSWSHAKIVQMRLHVWRIDRSSNNPEGRPMFGKPPIRTGESLRFSPQRINTKKFKCPAKMGEGGLEDK